MAGHPPHESAAPPAPRRAPPWPRVGAAVVLVLAGVLAVVTAHSPQDARPATTTQNRLADLVAAEQQRIADQSAEQRALSRQVASLTAAQAQKNSAVAAVARRGAALQAPVGLLAASGASVTVRLDDAPRGAPVEDGYPAPTADDLVVHQQDVQSVVNALWGGGAQAMTLMGQRVIATSAVRCVGNTLLLQGRVYSPPYVVTALGDSARLTRALDEAPGVRLFRQYVAAYGLRYGVTRAPHTTLPGYDGSIALTHAQPLPAAGAPAGGGS